MERDVLDAVTAVVIIDVQNGILRGRTTAREIETQRALDTVVERIARLIAAARRRGVPVIFVQHDGQPGHRLETDSEGWKIRAEIAPLAGEPVIRKTACDSFFRTTLQAELEARGTRRLIVAGCMTQHCVDTTVRRAVSFGYDVTLIADAHMTEDSGALRFEQIIAHHNGALQGFDAGEHLVTVTPLASVLAAASVLN